MSINLAIQQKKFKNEQEKVLVNLMYTSGWLNSLQVKFFKQFNLSPQQYNVLRILRGQQPKSICVGDIQERMLDKMSNASRLVDKLLQRNLVRRDTCNKDRRRMDVCITDEGMKLLDQIDEEHVTYILQLITIDELEAQNLNTLLDKLRTHNHK
jgi:DNA-binding MarR family transcriptional regulator